MCLASRWANVKGAEATEDDIDRMYNDFLPLQKEVLGQHCDMIPRAVDTFRWCVDHQIRVGSSTGYTRELMEMVLPIARKAGT